MLRRLGVFPQSLTGGRGSAIHGAHNQKTENFYGKLRGLSVLRRDGNAAMFIVRRRIRPRRPRRQVRGLRRVWVSGLLDLRRARSDRDKEELAQYEYFPAEAACAIPSPAPRFLETENGAKFAVMELAALVRLGAEREISGRLTGGRESAIRRRCG